MSFKAITVNSQSFIDRNEDSINLYFKNVRRYKTLTPEEEVALLAEIQKGGQKGMLAEERLITSNLCFVISVANKYKGCGLSLADLIQEANIGLIEAARSFDISYDCRFISYAVWHIRKSLTQAIAEHKNTVRMPSNQQKLVRAFKAMESKYYGEDIHSIKARFCEEKDIDDYELDILLCNDSKAKELDARVCNDDDCGATHADMLHTGSYTDESLDKESLHVDLIRMLDKVLTPCEREIIRMVFGIGCNECTITEASHKLGLSYEQVRLRRANALHKLEKSPFASNLRGHLAA